MKKTLCAVVILCMVVTIPSSQAANVSVFDDPIYVDTSPFYIEFCVCISNLAQFNLVFFHKNKVSNYQLYNQVHYCNQNYVTKITGQLVPLLRHKSHKKKWEIWNLRYKDIYCWCLC